VGVGEPQALGRQPVHAGRRNLAPLGIVALHVTPAEVVGEDDDDVRFGGRRRRRGRAERGERRQADGGEREQRQGALP